MAAISDRALAQQQPINDLDFPHLGAFLDRMQQGELVVESNQAFIVRRVSVLFTGKEIRPKDLVVMICHNINKLVLPLGKSIIMNTPSGSCTVKHATQPYFFVQLSMKWSIRCRELKTCRISDLFKAMILSNRLQVTFENQSLAFLQAANEEEEKENGLDAIVKNQVPGGYRLNAQTENFEARNVLIQYVTSQPGMMAVFKRAAFTLNELSHFYFPEAFRERMLLTGRLEILPDQEITIQGEELNRIGGDINAYIEPYQSEGFSIEILHLILSQLMLPTNYTISIDGKFSFSLKDGLLKIMAHSKVLFQLSQQEVILDLQDLAETLVQENETLSLEANQPLLLYNVDRKDIESISKATNSEELLNAFKNLLINRSIPGYTWGFYYEGKVSFETVLHEDKPVYLIVKCSEAMRLSIVPSEIENFVLTLLEQDEDLKTKVVDEKDPDAMLLVLFRTLFHYLVDYSKFFPEEPLPAYFKASTLQKMRELLNVKSPFQKALKALDKDPLLFREAKDFIANLNPEIYGNISEHINLGKPQTALAFVISTIRALADDEKQGSKFFEVILHSVMLHIAKEEGEKKEAPNEK